MSDRRSTGSGAREAIAAATDALEAAGLPTPRLDAEALLAGITGRPAAELVADRDASIAPADARSFSQAVRRRLRREPVAYILGSKGFRHIELHVDRRVLIPRPETEMLVELALSLSPGSVLDVGTGSGAVALAIADEIPDCRVTAGDTSAEALAVARSNAERLGLAHRVEFFEGTWPGPAGFDLIVSNLPYVAAGDELPADVSDWEPSAALFAGESGLEVFRQVLDSLGTSGVDSPAIALEIGHGQAEEVMALVREAGFERARLLRDLAGLERVVLGGRAGLHGLR